jgi:hypothetical protein
MSSVFYFKYNKQFIRESTSWIGTPYKVGVKFDWQEQKLNAQYTSQYQVSLTSIWYHSFRNKPDGQNLQCKHIVQTVHNTCSSY